MPAAHSSHDEQVTVGRHLHGTIFVRPPNVCAGLARAPQDVGVRVPEAIAPASRRNQDIGAEVLQKAPARRRATAVMSGTHRDDRRCAHLSDPIALDVDTRIAR